MKTPKANSNKGQAIIEYVLLLAVLVLVSGLILNLFGGAISIRWKAMSHMIAAPTPSGMDYTEQVQYP